jgi:hypothetical protein
MVSARYEKRTGTHAGHVYIVVAPYSEIKAPLRWTLQCETVADEKLIVAENELGDPTLWQPLQQQ